MGNRFPDSQREYLGHNINGLNYTMQNATEDIWVDALRLRQAGRS